MNRLERKLDSKGFHTIRLGRNTVKALDTRSGFDTEIMHCFNGEYRMVEVDKDTGIESEPVFFASINEWYKTLIKS